MNVFVWCCCVLFHFFFFFCWSLSFPESLQGGNAYNSALGATSLNITAQSDSLQCCYKRPLTVSVPLVPVQGLFGFPAEQFVLLYIDSVYVCARLCVCACARSGLPQHWDYICRLHNALITFKCALVYFLPILLKKFPFLIICISYVQEMNEWYWTWNHSFIHSLIDSFNFLHSGCELLFQHLHQIKTISFF